MMKADFSIVGTHAKGYPANVNAQQYGDHTPHVLLSSDTDNGNIVGIGDWDHWDVFQETTPTTFEGKIVDQMVDGTWLVLVKNAVNAAFVYQKPMTPYESPAELLNEKVMYNPAGSVVRTYMLKYLDRIAVSDEGFNGTPKVGATITGVENKKMTIGA